MSPALAVAEVVARVLVFKVAHRHLQRLPNRMPNCCYGDAVPCRDEDSQEDKLPDGKVILEPVP